MSLFEYPFNFFECPEPPGSIQYCGYAYDSSDMGEKNLKTDTEASSTWMGRKITYIITLFSDLIASITSIFQEKVFLPEAISEPRHSSPPPSSSTQVESPVQTGLDRDSFIEEFWPKYEDEALNSKNTLPSKDELAAMQRGLDLFEKDIEDDKEKIKKYTELLAKGSENGRQLSTERKEELEWEINRLTNKVDPDFYGALLTSRKIVLQTLNGTRTHVTQKEKMEYGDFFAYGLTRMGQTLFIIRHHLVASDEEKLGLISQLARNGFPDVKLKDLQNMLVSF